MSSWVALIRELHKLNQELEYIWARYSGPKAPDGMPHLAGRITDPVCDLACRTVDIYDRIFCIKKQLREILVCLPPREKKMMELRYIKGRKWALVAKEIGCSVSHAKYLHKKARQKLDKTLA